MKKVTLIIYFLIFSLCVKSQVVGMDTYSFGDKEDNMISKLSDQSKSILFSFLKHNFVDTNIIYRVKYSEIFTTYTTKEYLSEHNHKFLFWTKINDTLNHVEHDKICNTRDMNLGKLIITYSTNNKGSEHLSIYILN